MIKPVDDIISAQSAHDPSRYKQARKEQGVDWSERLLPSGLARNGDGKLPGARLSNSTEKKELENSFFSMLLSDSENLSATDSHGTTNSRLPLNKQEDEKKKIVSEEFQISSQDFGSAKVEVKMSSHSIFLSMVIEKPLPVQHVAILQKLVANRLGHQFGKNFEVQITCKS